MAQYKHILVPLDLQQDSERVLSAALDVGKRNNARISALHVVEYAPIDPGGDIMLPTPVDITDQLAARAKTELEALCRKCGAENAAQRVVVGSIKGEILQAAAGEGVDLIVIGSYERHGLALLLSHTEDTVLHSAPCDVLAVRLNRR
jgi:universal stress protein A